MTHYTNESFVRTPGGSLIRIGKLTYESGRTRLFEKIAENLDTYHDDATGKTWRVRNGTLERYYAGTLDALIPDDQRAPTPEEIIAKTAEHILTKVKEMMAIPLLPDGVPEQIWSRAMEEAARILSHGFNMSSQTHDGFLNVVKTDRRWRERNDYPWKEVRSPSIVITATELIKEAKQAKEAAEAGEFKVINQPGTWTRVDTPAYKQKMEEMRNKAWTEGVEMAIDSLKAQGHHTAAYRLGLESVNDPRWKK